MSRLVHDSLEKQEYHFTQEENNCQDFHLDEDTKNVSTLR